jgi:hypothetical protein
MASVNAPRVMIAKITNAPTAIILLLKSEVLRLSTKLDSDEIRKASMYIAISVWNLIRSLSIPFCHNLWRPAMNAKAITRQSCRRLLQVSGVATAALMLEGLPLTARAENAGKSLPRSINGGDAS